MKRSHNLALQSPEPVARRFPVGENDAQRIGEVWPVGGNRKSGTRHDSEIGRTIEPGAERDAPERVEEQRVAGRTLKTA